MLISYNKEFWAEFIVSLPTAVIHSPEISIIITICYEFINFSIIAMLPPQ